MAKATDSKKMEDIKETTPVDEGSKELVPREVPGYSKEDAQLAELGDYSVDDYNLDDLGFDDNELDELSGLDSINAGDIRVPYAKLHSKAQNGFELGDIELVDGTVIKGNSGEVLKGVSILKIQSVRVYFPEKFNKKNTFICRSFDNKVGAPDGKYRGQACATCEFSKFPAEGGSSPCREQILLLCTLDDGTLFHLLVSGIGVKEFKSGFMSVEMMKGLRIVKRKLKRQILAALNLNVTVAMEGTEFGEFPKMVFKVDKDSPMVSPARLKSNLEAYGSYKEFEDEAVATAATFAQTEQGDYEGGDAGAASGPNGDMF